MSRPRTGISFSLFQQFICTFALTCGQGREASQPKLSMKQLFIMSLPSIQEIDLLKNSSFSASVIVILIVLFGSCLLVKDFLNYRLSNFSSPRPKSKIKTDTLVLGTNQAHPPHPTRPHAHFHFSQPLKEQHKSAFFENFVELGYEFVMMTPCACQIPTPDFMDGGPLASRQASSQAKAKRGAFIQRRRYFYSTWGSIGTELGLGSGLDNLPQMDWEKTINNWDKRLTTFNCYNFRGIYPLSDNASFIGTKRQNINCTQIIFVLLVRA